MATYVQTTTVNDLNQAVSLSDNGSTSVNIVVPTKSKATIRVFVSASMPTGPITSASASFSSGGSFGTIASASISTNTTADATVEQVVLGEGTYTLSVSMSGVNPGNGTATSRIIGILETFS